MDVRKIARLLSKLKKREGEMIERVQTWSNINSGSSNADGVSKMADLLQQELAELTSEVEQIALPLVVREDEEGNRKELRLGPAVRAAARRNAPIQVLLSGHFDTVFDRQHPFQKVEKAENRLIGPGVADMKGGLVVMIEALRILEESPERERIGWEVFLNPDEEIGSLQSAVFLREAAARHDFGLAFEPALPDGDLVSGRWGTGNFRISVSGKPAHVGREFEKGRNAIAALADWISRVHLLNERSGVIANIGRISGGGALNVVPETSVCGMNLRVESEKILEEVEKELAEISRQIEEKHEVKIDFGGEI